MHMAQTPYVWGTKGIIEPRIEKDQYDNDVSIVSTPSYKYRLVHHTPVDAPLQKATCYAGRKFLRFMSFMPEGDVTQDHTVDFGGYSITWNIGESEVKQRENAPPALCDHIRAYDEAHFVIEVLDAIPAFSFPELWQVKEQKLIFESTPLAPAAVADSGFIADYNEPRRRSNKPVQQQLPVTRTAEGDALREAARKQLQIMRENNYEQMAGRLHRPAVVSGVDASSVAKAVSETVPVVVVESEKGPKRISVDDIRNLPNLMHDSKTHQRIEDAVVTEVTQGKPRSLRGLNSLSGAIDTIDFMRAPDKHHRVATPITIPEAAPRVAEPLSAEEMRAKLASKFKVK